MHNKKFIELANKKIDGNITPDEENWLNSYLQDNSFGRKYLNDLEKSIDTLKIIKDVDPPASLKEKITGAIDHELYIKKPVVKKKSLWSYSFIPSPKMSLAFTCGLFLGILMMTFIINKDFNDPGALSGTIGFPEHENLPVTDQIELNTQQVLGRISLHEAAGVIILDTRLQGMVKDLQLFVEYNPQQLAFMGYKNMQQSIINLESQEGLLKLQSGTDYDAQLLFNKLSPSTARVNFKIISTQKTLVSRSIKINSKN